jgi:hypothetical protein
METTTCGRQSEYLAYSMRRAVLQFLLNRGSLSSHDWIRLSKTPLFKNSNHLCSNCGRRTNTYTAHFSVIRAEPRRIRICPVCDVIEDAPINFPSLAISISNKYTVRINGGTRRKDSTLGLLLEYQLRSLRTRWVWPTGPDGMPERDFQIPISWPPGPLHVALFFVQNKNFAVFRRPLRIDVANN